MVCVFTFPIEVSALNRFFTFLGRSEDNRFYYISKNYLEEFFAITGEENGYSIFMKELKTGQLQIMECVSAWLNIPGNAVLHLTTEEMDDFISLVEASSKPDVYFNLMTKEDEEDENEITLGQHIFINSLAEIVRRVRNV